MIHTMRLLLLRFFGVLEEREDVDYFELPTISRMNAVMRWIIYRGMRSGIKDEGDRARTVTLHIDKEPFKSGLKIDSEESIVLLVVDDKGKVLGRSKGALLDLVDQLVGTHWVSKCCREDASPGVMVSTW